MMRGGQIPCSAEHHASTEYLTPIHIASLTVERRHERHLNNVTEILGPACKNTSSPGGEHQRGTFFFDRLLVMTIGLADLLAYDIVHELFRDVWFDVDSGGMQQANLIDPVYTSDE